MFRINLWKGVIRGSILAQRMVNFADPTCQFWLVFAGSLFGIFKKVRIILRPKLTNLIFCLPTIYVNRLARKKPETLCDSKTPQNGDSSHFGNLREIFLNGTLM